MYSFIYLKCIHIYIYIWPSVWWPPTPEIVMVSICIWLFACIWIYVDEGYQYVYFKLYVIRFMYVCVYMSTASVRVNVYSMYMYMYMSMYPSSPCGCGEGWGGA